jgi:magnesium transporter
MLSSVEAGADTPQEVEMLTIRHIVEGEVAVLTPQQCAGLKGNHEGVIWIDAVGDDPTVAASLLEFGIEPWVIEDMMETSTHPKAESWPGAHFLVVFALEVVADETRFEPNLVELDAVLGDGWLVTHTSRPLDLIERTAALVSRDTREAGTAAELLHLILDRLVDRYEPLIDDFIPDAIEAIEDRLFSGRVEASARQEIYLRRRDVQRLQRIAAPQVAAVRRIATLAEAEDLQHRHLFTDIADRLAYVAGQVDSLRGQLNAAFDHYQSLVAHSQNEVMKVLTMVSATLLPITVVAGIYGMNFVFMPELDERWGYPFALSLSALIVVGNIWYFRAKGWIGRRERVEGEPRSLELDPGVVLRAPAMGARTLAHTTKRLVRWGLSR